MEMPHWDVKHRNSFCIEFNSYIKFLVAPPTPNIDGCSPITNRFVSELTLAPASPVNATAPSASVRETSKQTARDVDYMRPSPRQLLNHLLDSDGMQEGLECVLRTRPFYEVETGDSDLAAAPDVLWDGVARADVAAEEGGVDACVQAGGVPLEQYLEGVGTREMCAGGNPVVDLEEGGADFGFGGDADCGVVVGAIGDERLEAFEDDAEGEGGECEVCGRGLLEGEERREYGAEGGLGWVFGVHTVQPGLACAGFESCFAAGKTERVGCVAN
ncbi:hypothetical protein O988_03366 [Pseudogymnoascus sp. VKM F-3808]|nr:hypothetical protein O988_03366 [Pseudogymnoascus sp. VKM F-3808]